MRKSVAVLGGDIRQIRLAQLLHDDGWDTMTWGLEKGDAWNPVPLDRALKADIVVLPLPVCRNGDLNLPLTDTVLTPGDLWSRLHPKQLLLGGMTGELSKQLKDRLGLELLDYYNREEVQIANAVPTAEGAIMRVMEETEYIIQGSSCLVIGYGRIGKALAHRLRALGAIVTVTARKPSDQAWIKACGCRAVMMNQLHERLGGFDVIFNTAPALVLDAARLESVRPDCLIVELASLPGGMDMDAVKQKNLRVIVERGLPGKVAPLSAARTIRDGIYHILEERGELN